MHKEEGVAPALLRPENVRLHTVTTDASADVAAEPGTTGRIEESTFLGSFRRTVVRTDDGAIVHVQHDVADRYEYGQPVRLTLVPVAVAVRPAA